MFDIGGGDGDRLILDVAVATRLTDGRDAQRVILVALGERDDRLGHGRREHQRAAFGRRRIEDLLEVFAEAHVEHLVRLVEHGDAQRGEVERAAFEVIAQAARRADDDMRAVAERATLLAGVHAADAGRDARMRFLIQPHQLAADLQREFARRCDDQREGEARRRQRAVDEQFARHGEAEGDRLARTGLGGDDEIAAGGFRFDYRGLDGGRRFIATGDERFSEKRGQGGKGHGKPKIKAGPEAHADRAGLERSRSTKSRWKSRANAGGNTGNVALIACASWPWP